jgi:hypothetical protein
MADVTSDVATAEDRPTARADPERRDGASGVRR